jgi:Reverse transcriptase (RNA-dependent DNA polymerase)
VHVFNLSINSGIFPEKIKVSRTVPIFKSGDKNSCDNYRPIALLSVLSKVLEKAVAGRLLRHLRDNDIINHNQFGFKEGVSTVHHLLKLTNFITQKLNERMFTVGIFLDLRKAFDVVSHDILLLKLKRIGVQDVALGWFASYLGGRKQRVEINGKLSDLKNIDISIMQGSILGPILFLCFINDLPNCTELLTLLFADDTACLIAGPNLKEILAKANIELQKIANWFRANKMAVNVSKTIYIIFKPRGVKIELCDNEGVFTMIMKLAVSKTTVK